MIADDDQRVCDALADLVASDPRVELVAASVDIEAALETASRLRPDLAIVEVKRPVHGGVRVVRRLVEGSPGIRVVAISTAPDSRFESAVQAAGAAGFAVKGDATELLDVIAGLLGEQSERGNP